MIQIALSKRHKETNPFYIREVLCQRLNLLMVQKIHILLSHLIKRIIPLNAHGRNFNPMAVLPVASRSGNLTQVDLRVKIGGKCIAVVAPVTV